MISRTKYRSFPTRYVAAAAISRGEMMTCIETQTPTQNIKIGEVVVNISISSAVIDKVKSMTQNKIMYNAELARFERTNPLDPAEYIRMAEKFNQIIRQRATEIVTQRAAQSPQNTSTHSVVIDLDGQLEQMLIKAYNSSMLWLIYRTEIVPKTRIIEDRKILDDLDEKISKTIEQLSQLNTDDARKQFTEISKDLLIDALNTYIDQLESRTYELSDYLHTKCR